MSISDLNAQLAAATWTTGALVAPTCGLALRLALAVASVATPGPAHQDGTHRELATCEAAAEATTPELAELAFESCVQERGL
jgi:hypothetical protein